MVLCPCCQGGGEVRLNAYATAPCTMCETTGQVAAILAHEYLLAHPDHPFNSPSEGPTRVPCPACEHCGACNGTRSVTAGKAAEIRRALHKEPAIPR